MIQTRSTTPAVCGNQTLFQRFLIYSWLEYNLLWLRTSCSLASTAFTSYKPEYGSPFLTVSPRECYSLSWLKRLMWVFPLWSVWKNEPIIKTKDSGQQPKHPFDFRGEWGCGGASRPEMCDPVHSSDSVVDGSAPQSLSVESAAHWCGMLRQGQPTSLLLHPPLQLKGWKTNLGAGVV